MADRPYNVLILCTGNSARSILAEALVNKEGAGRFQGYSAGSTPKDAPNPYALEVVDDLGFDRRDFRSKSWDEFAVPGAPKIDLVITVCDNAAGEVCPIWPGRPTTAHWGLPDPADAQGSPELIRASFDRARQQLTRRVRALADLPDAALEGADLKARLREIHEVAAAAERGS